MQDIRYFLFFVLISSPLLAEMPFPQCDENLCATGCEGSHVWVGGEWIYWKPRKADLDYAFHYNGTTLFGDVEHVSPHYHNGFKIFAEAESGRLFFGTHYTYFTAREDNSVEDLVFDQLAATRLPVQNSYTIPGDIQHAQASYGVRLHIGQVESGYSLRVRKSVHATLLGGFSGVFIKQKLNLLYATNAEDAEEEPDRLIPLNSMDLIKSSVDMSAYGPYVGFNVRWEWFKGVGIYSRATVGSLLAKFNRHYAHSGTPGNLLIATDDAVEDKTHRIISHIDLASGIYIEGFDCSAIKVSLTLGCQIHHFFNLADFFDLRHTDVIDEHAFDYHGDGLGFDGLYLGLMLTF